MKVSIVNQGAVGSNEFVIVHDHRAGPKTLKPGETHQQELTVEALGVSAGCAHESTPLPANPYDLRTGAARPIPPLKCATCGVLLVAGS